MGDHELIVRVIDIFRTDVPRQIHALREFLERADAPGALRYAHSIKGAAANVGAERLRSVALDMEKSATAGDVAAVRGLMADLEAEFWQLDGAMEAGLRPEPGLTANP
jgi:HPt (histidine-containing phosphotransfer) domain-containing protein